MFADGITYEPSACAWSWGRSSFSNHWHGVSNTFKSLSVVYGRDPMHDFGLILRTGTDVNLTQAVPFLSNFSRIFEEYALHPVHATQVRGG